VLEWGVGYLVRFVGLVRGPPTPSLERQPGSVRPYGITDAYGMLRCMQYGWFRSVGRASHVGT
jgi:hypothetical protein